jgi:hypothetical protein
MPERTKTEKAPWYISALIIIVFVLLSPAILIAVMIFLIPWLNVRFIRRPRLLRKVKNEWISQNKYILFVYSDNELWKAYAENHIIPKIESRAVILNWSRRKEWIHSNSLAAQLFRNYHWGREWIWRNRVRMGGQEYNHLAMIFKPWNKPKIISFWKAFKDYEFGKDEKLKAVENELYDSL